MSVYEYRYICVCLHLCSFECRGPKKILEFGFSGAAHFVEMRFLIGL